MTAAGAAETAIVTFGAMTMGPAPPEIIYLPGLNMLYFLEEIKMSEYKDKQEKVKALGINPFGKKGEELDVILATAEANKATKANLAAESNKATKANQTAKSNKAIKANLAAEASQAAEEVTLAPVYETLVITQPNEKLVGAKEETSSENELKKLAESLKQPEGKAEPKPRKYTKDEILKKVKKSRTPKKFKVIITVLLAAVAIVFGILLYLYINVSKVWEDVKYALNELISKNYIFEEPILNTLLKKRNKNRKIILLTAHRRENLGEPMKNICNAVKQILEVNREAEVVFPVHLNPIVQDIVYPVLSPLDRVHLVKPLCVRDMHNILNRSYIVMTDSGGVQEEAAALRKPVIVMRRDTERPEIIDAGVAVLAGTDQQEIFSIASELLNNDLIYKKMQCKINPFGDGRASERIINAILFWAGLTNKKLKEFSVTDRININIEEANTGKMI